MARAILCFIARLLSTRLLPTAIDSRQNRVFRTSKKRTLHRRQRAFQGESGKPSTVSVVNVLRHNVLTMKRLHFWELGAFFAG
jgi:hypothetical protein